MKKNNQDQLVPLVSESIEGGFNTFKINVKSRKNTSQKSQEEECCRVKFSQTISITDHASNKQQRTAKKRTGDG